MEIKKSILILFILLFGISGIYAISFSEDEQGNSFYETDEQMKVPSMNIRDLLLLQPSAEPLNPELGMIYFDSTLKRLKLYDGTGWYAIALEKVTSVSKKQIKEKTEKKDEVKTCEFSITCDEWGDCINNYQSMTCVTTDENCDKHTDTETKDCISESPFKEEIQEAQEESVEAETTPIEEEVEEEAEEEEVEEEEPEEEPEEEVEEEAEEETIPEELFDITFDLEESALAESDKLVVWITLQNFGRRYVPARLVYSVTDNQGEEVYRSFEELRVYTDQSIIKRFDDLILEQGDYTLSMSVEYAGIVEEFSDNFSIETGIFSIIKRFFARLFS